MCIRDRSRFPTTFENGDKILSGWNTSKDGTGTPVDANTVVTEDMTLYAQWSEPAVDLDVAVSYSNVDEAGETIWTNQDVTVTLTAVSYTHLNELLLVCKCFCFFFELFFLCLDLEIRLICSADVYKRQPHTSARSLSPVQNYNVLRMASFEGQQKIHPY